MPTMPDEIIVDHEKRQILIDGVEYPHYLGEDVIIVTDERPARVDVSLLAKKVTEVGEPATRVPANATTVGSVNGAILLRLGDGEASEVGAFTIPIHAHGSDGRHGVVITGFARVQRALAAFAAALDEEE